MAGLWKDETVPSDQLSQRVGTAEREQVLELLGKALEEGYLSLDEYEQRAAVTAVAKTAYDLTQQVTDLPPRLRWVPQPRTVAQARPGGHGTATPNSAHTTAVASLVLGLVSIPMSVCIGTGGIIGVAAAVLSRPGLRSPQEHGKAMVGLVTGLLGVALSAAFLLLIILG